MNHTLAGMILGIKGAHMMRAGALALLTNDDLAFSPGGDNVTLGELFKRSGELHYSYWQSLKTFRQDWSYRNPAEGIASSKTQLEAWFADLDTQMGQTLDQLTEVDLSQPIDRTQGIIRSVAAQLEIYTQALMIFLGQVVIYFKAMQKQLPPSMQQYIA